MPADVSDPRGERLQKILAHAGIAARRKCEEYILAGRVKVNGQVVTTLGSRARPGIDLIEFDGQPVVPRQRRLVYYLLYKPVGYLSTVRDPQGRPTVLSLVESEERLYPAGRLDYDSEGLLLLTNDGELAYRLMHPRHHQKKEYIVAVEGQPSAEELARLAKGVHIQDETRRLFVRGQAEALPAPWRWRGEAAPAGCSWVRVVLEEGHKRQIRRMFEVLGHPVQRLIRVRLGTLELGDLAPGQGRWLNHKEARSLRRSVGLCPDPDEAAGNKSHQGEDSERDHHRHRRPGGVGQEHRRRPVGR